MPLPVNGYNKTFTAFVQFAENSIRTGDKKAIANVAETNLGKRKIVASTTDGVGLAGMFRTKFEEGANDNARKLFLNAVTRMFGGRSKIPESVWSAIKLEDYGHGQPLTARRIIAVKQAIDVYKGDMQPLKLSLAKATTMIADARRRLFPVLDTDDIDEETLACAAEWLKKYGSGMPAKTIRVLANYIVNSMFDKGLDEEDIERVAKDMKGWREFDFGDKRLTKLGEKFTQRCNDYMKLQLTKPRQYMQNDPNIFSQLYGDANRGDWRIGNTRFPLGTKPDMILAKFLEVVKKPNARKVVSTFLNQGSLADMETLLFKNGAGIGDTTLKNFDEEDLFRIKGGEMFVSRDARNNNGIGITREKDVHYSLDVSKDGKTATVTVSVDKNLNTKTSLFNEFNIGMATISQRITIDLTKEMPEVTNVTFSQAFSPEVINIDPQRWAGEPRNVEQPPPVEA
jgi:hypothetical protein